jgi:hypothetical protein
MLMPNLRVTSLTSRDRGTFESIQRVEGVGSDGVFDRLKISGNLLLRFVCKQALRLGHLCQ